MKKNSLLLMGLMFLLFTAACSNTDIAEDSGLVQVEIKTVQDTLQPGRAILIDASVTQGTEKVTDAREVKFEIWKKGQEKHEMITAQHWQDGTYRIKTMFPEDGIYNVTAHVTGRDTDVIPTKELIVGNGSAS
ncbi:FixH family protein [Paenibacillus sp. J2TS4]|uniref:FixH family protein n=1 Tax=Paenibacillus sp. J2TS4 TaxID=2807194 RepID=UPI001B01A6A3|nr:FixH family protein [Paenibacillus sp. J2TS4]GIP31757.1 hypothetical protein J2TS4_09670 [Paenibacillus sp. J2TS4]